MLASRSSHHRSKSNEVVDFDSLVWPPPELRPPPTPVPLVVHGANNQQYKVYPGQSFSEARRLAGIKRSGTSSSNESDDRFEQPEASASWTPPSAPLTDNRPPLRQKSKVPSTSSSKPKLANGPAESNNGRFGCKDYPSGYVPTPRPHSPPVNPRSIAVPIFAPKPGRVTPPPPSTTEYTFNDRSQSFITEESSIITCPTHPTQQSTGFFEPYSIVVRPDSHAQDEYASTAMGNARVAQSSRSRSQSRPNSTAMSFFEPYSVVIRPDNKGQDDFISPVMENGRVVSYCRIPGRTGLSPGGIIERDRTFSEDSYSTTPASRDVSRSLFLGTDSASSAGTSPQIILPEHLKDQRPFSPATSSSSSYVPNYPSTRPTSQSYSRRHSQHEQHESIAPTFAPTRLGYWNRRGDTIGVDGRIISALGTKAYPPDLANYPQYALVNEQGRVLLPENEHERVAMWRHNGGVAY